MCQYLVSKGANPQVTGYVSHNKKKKKKAEVLNLKVVTLFISFIFSLYLVILFFKVR